MNNCWTKKNITLIYHTCHTSETVTRYFDLMKFSWQHKTWKCRWTRFLGIRYFQGHWFWSTSRIQSVDEAANKANALQMQTIWRQSAYDINCRLQCERAPVAAWNWVDENIQPLLERTSRPHTTAAEHAVSLVSSSCVARLNLHNTVSGTLHHADNMLIRHSSICPAK